MSRFLTLLIGIVLISYAFLVWSLGRGDGLNFVAGLYNAPEWANTWIESRLSAPAHVNALIGVLGILFVGWGLSVGRKVSGPVSRDERISPALRATDDGHMGERISPTLRNAHEEHTRESVPPPLTSKEEQPLDLDVGDAMEHIDQMLEPERTDENEQRIADIGGLLRRAATKGDVTISGEEYQPGHRPTLRHARRVPIPQAYWETMEMDLLVCMFSRQYEPATRPDAKHEHEVRNDDRPVYANLKVPRNQIDALWRKVRRVERPSPGNPT